MSVFTDDGTVTTVHDDDAQGSFLERLVQEKGENWKDPEVLAKGKIEADKFIEDLKRQNEELREDLTKESKLDDLIKLIQESNKAPAGAANNDSNDAGHSTDGPDFTEEKLEALIKQHISQRDVERDRERNSKEVERALLEAYGGDANRILKQRAAELDLSMQEVEELASTKPKAFFRLMGLDKSGNQAGKSNLVGSSTNSEAVHRKGDRRDWNFYQKLRRENKRDYYSQSVQRQMLRDREEMGEASFYGRG